MPRMLLTAVLTLPLFCRAAEPAAGTVEFFESKIRPVLASACYDCHGTARQKSSLRLDWREGLLKGGERGPAIVPGDPDKSLLIQAIARTHAELKMPKNAGALSAATVADFREWIRMGATDPRDKPPSADVAQAADWPSVFSLRKQWWCWQPLKAVDPPDIPGVEHPVDRFLIAEMQKHGLTPAPPADPATVRRRLAFVLTGLPPSDDETHRTHESYSSYADSLLASPQFGERWARHWMDWLRYAESHGSEGDPAIPHAYQYRDYLIRALNADVPYPQLVREHIAGDLLPPRLSADGSLNEAAIGPAHLRMVFHGFTPTDALDERVTFTDNQVDVVSKAFLGLTVSCARCHNHKFDAISQEDYYAMFGVFANVRPATVDVRARAGEAAILEQLASLKKQITAAVKEDWETSLHDFPQRLAAWQPKNEAELKEADSEGHGPLAVWLGIKEAPAEGSEFMNALRDALNRSLAATRTLRDWHRATQPSGNPVWNTLGDTINWSGHGAGLAAPLAQTEFSLTSSGDRLTDGLLPSGYSSSRFTPDARGVLTSSPFQAPGGRLWIRAHGQNAGLRFVVQNYPRSGLIFPKAAIASSAPRWMEFNLDYWKGDAIHLEAWTAADAPVETGNDGGQFTLWEVALPADQKLSPPPDGIPVTRFTSSIDDATNRAEVLAAYTKAIRAALAALTAEALAQRHSAEFLNFFVRTGLLPSTANELPTAAPLVEEFRKHAAQLPVPIRAPGVMEGGPGDWPLYVRGDHKKPGDRVPRRFLEAIDSAPYNTKESGRRELAESIAGPGSALASRVIVNRLWHHVFGRGLVATTDNFGKLGDLPTHPELIDWLALRFQKDGGSIKKMLRLLVTSQAFIAASQPSPLAAELDPENKLLSHWTLRRMEAEAIRDAILSVSGKLDLTAGGPAVEGGTPRRSVYVKVIRNDLDPFLTAFDSPVPSSTRGRRDVTNVPAQALALMNSPMIRSWADAWAERVCRESADETTRVRRLFGTAFQREPQPDELQRSLAFVHDAAVQAEKVNAQADELRKQLASPPAPESPWRSLALALINMKEFIYLR